MNDSDISPLAFDKKKERSPSFPFISLERGLERVRQFYAEEKRGAAPYQRAVLHWSYSEASSGGLQTTAALKQYGLINDVGGSGKARQLQLSELALRIILDQRPDSPERATYIKQAALTPGVANEVHTRWPDGLPSDATLHHFLVLEKKFNEGAATSAIKILKENQVFASISITDLQSPNADLMGEAMIDVQPVNHATPRRDAREPTQAHGAPVLHAPAGAAQLVLRNSGVVISIHFSEEPTKEVFEYLAKYCTFEAGNVPARAVQAAGADGGS